METLANGMCLKIFQKRVPNIDEVIEEISHIRGKIGGASYVQFQQVQINSRNEYVVVVASDKGIGPKHLNTACPLQVYMDDFGLQNGWTVIMEDSVQYREIEIYLLYHSSSFNRLQ